MERSAISESISGSNLEISNDALSILETKWFLIMEFVCSNQKQDILVSIFPLSGIPLGRTISKAEILSVAIISNNSSFNEYVSLTLPLLKEFGRFVCINATISINFFLYLFVQIYRQRTLNNNYNQRAHLSRQQLRY